MSGSKENKINEVEVGFQIPDILTCIYYILKHKKLIVITTFCVAVLTSAVTLLMPNTYTAKAMIVPADNDSGMMGAMMAQMGGLASLASGGGSNNADLYVTMLNSETVKDLIVDRFKLMSLYKSKLRQDVYNKLDKYSDFSIGKKDGVLTISFEDLDPNRAAEIANAYVDELSTVLAGINRKGASDNRGFIEEQLASAKTALARAEELMTAFQTHNKAISVPDQAKEAISEVSQLRGQLVAYEVQLGTLQHQFTDNSHEIKSVKAAIANIKSQLSRLEGQGNKGSIPSVGDLPQLGQEYLRLLRELKVQETLVETLTKQYEVVKLKEVKDVSAFSIIQKAKPPEVKSNPKRGVIVISTSLATFLFLAIIVVVVEATRSSRNDKLSKWHEVMALLSINKNFRDKR